MLTGLWHGASWNFVLWGLLFAVMLLLEKWVLPLDKLPGLVRRVDVLLIVALSFVLFNAVSLQQAVGDITAMFGFAGLPAISAETVYYLRSYGMLFIAGFIGATPLLRDTLRKLEGNGKTAKVLSILEPITVLVLLILCTAYLVDGSFNPFLYFRF
jgi:alginate O-acetyltransferase complex protein AlgI